MKATEQFTLLDQPPAGWFPVAVMPVESNRKWDWCAFMMDVHPDVYRADRSCTAQRAFVRIPGKHRSLEAAWNALDDLLATRH